MKKISVMIACMFIISLLLCSAASAETITAMATEINPEHLEKTASYARILGYDKEANTLTVELIVPEVFSFEDVQALKVGDSIYSGGQEIVIETLDWNEGGEVLWINDSAVGLIELSDGSGDYQAMEEYGDNIWTVLAVIKCPVKDDLLFLDYIDESSGDMKALPFVRTVDEFLDRLENGPVAFDANNVYVVFDGSGRLASIQRYYVPWQ